jgi:hypothetical protein
VLNLLTVLAQQGDQTAIEALRQLDNVSVLEDEGDDEVQVIIDQSNGSYLITEHGASFVDMPKPKED